MGPGFGEGRSHASLTRLQNYLTVETTIETPIRIWPHHFDIAFLHILRPEPYTSIGVGLSPGDESYDQPYFYLGP